METNSLETSTEPPDIPSGDNTSPAEGRRTGGAPNSSADSAASRAGGRGLAEAWLSGFLTRTSRDDSTWAEHIADLTDPGLLRQLKQQGPDLVGLDELTSWRVYDVRAVKSTGAPPIATPTRQILSYAAVVGDGRHRFEKPFQLYAYLEGERWVVGAIYLPYSSEG